MRPGGLIFTLFYIYSQFHPLIYMFAPLISLSLPSEVLHSCEHYVHQVCVMMASVAVKTALILETGKDMQGYAKTGKDVGRCKEKIL